MTDGPNDNPQYVDLGDWTGDTCFVSVDSCEQGIERVAGGRGADHFVTLVTGMKAKLSQKSLSLNGQSNSLELGSQLRFRKLVKQR